MKIKIGDKVRVKTVKELWAEGWTPDSYNLELRKDGLFVWRSDCGQIDKVEKLDKDGLHFETSELWLPISAVEVLPQTLDEYICSLPLEERAKWFVHSRYDVEYDCDRYFSTVTYDSYFDYDEALRATIESLKGEKR